MATNILDNIKEKYCDITVYDSRWSLKEIITPNLVRKRHLSASRKRKRAAVELSSCSYSDLFTTQDTEKTIRKIVIEGAAGIGKTTLCTTITRDWAMGKLFQQFELVLMLPIHEKKLASVTSIDVLFNQLHDANTCAFIINYLENHGEKVLIIADGWDAMSPVPEQQKQCILYSILFGKHFPTISVIVASRPSTALRTLQCIDQFIGLHGFNKEIIKWCMQSYFPNKKEVAIKQFESNPLIENVCSVPLNCAIICDMMDNNEELNKELTLPSTMTELYNNLILHIINNSIKETNSCVIVSSLSDLPDDLMLPWQSLCAIAFQAVFPIGSEAQANSVNLSSSGVDNFFEFGLVKSVTIDEGKLTFHFCHEDIKAYLAALHLVQQPQDTQLSIFHTYASLRQLTMVWRYFFGVYFREKVSTDCNFIEQCIQILAAKHITISSGDGYMFCHYSFETRSKIINDEVVKMFTTTKCQSPANLPVIHFGNPRTAHDCAAILYFIANIEQKICVELNFSHCLRDGQLQELVHILDSQKGVIQLKTLDLSENWYSDDDMIVGLFKKLESTVKFIEKLILRNCHIGEDGMDTIMAVITLPKSQSIKFLDFSYNSVSLYMLRDIVLTGALENLEVLFLQGSVVEQEDLPCLAELFDALLSSCKCLRRLDLSANNFGDPGNPFLSSIISQMTSICENFDLVLDRQYMSEVEKNFIEIMEESIRKKGTIDHTVAHGVIVGPGRSGKNSLMNRLLGKGPPPPGFQSCSTGVLECVRKIEVKKLCTAVSGFGLQWNELKYDEEAVELMTTTARSYSAKLELVEKGGDKQPTSSSNETAVSFIDEFATTTSRKRTSQTSVVAPKRLKLVKHVKDSNIKNKCRKQKRENLLVYSSNVSSTEIFKKALQLRRMDGLREQLESSWSLYLTNTGGQIEFQELLPLLVSGPSIFFITFPLDRKLTDHYTVQYQHKDGSVQTYPSPSTLLDEILQTLATISTLNSEHLECQPAGFPEHNASLRPKVFFVGTHKDLVPKSSREKIIEDIDSTLQNYIQKTSLFEQGSIEYASPTKRLIFTVDNLAEDDDDFQKIRLALELTVERSEDFTIRCPSTWLVFSLILRAKDKFSQVLTYSECFKIAQSCGISDRTELNNALFFIHTRLGLLRYFSVDGLNSLVILDPQVLFDRITDLIVSTYTKEHAEANEIHEFQNRGILSVDTIRRLTQKSNSKSQIPLDWLLQLLNYLRIAAYFKDHAGEKYFFPSVVCHAPEQQTESSVPRDHTSLLVAFKDGFCPRGISGALIKYLMTNEMNSQLTWELHFRRIYKNQVTFGIKTLGDIILKIHPTHLELQFDPQSDQSDLTLTCNEAFTQIKRGMKEIINEQHYFFAFYCTRLECENSPHPAKIEWRGSNPSKIKCHFTERKGNLPKGYEIWIKSTEKVYQVTSKHIGEIADKMWEWEGTIAEKLGLTRPEVAEIKMKHDRELKLQIRAALEKWKQKNGPMATYHELIRVFERACCHCFAEVVKRICDREMMIQQPYEMMDGCIPSSPPLLPQPSTYPKLQSPQFPSTPLSVEPFVLTNEASNNSENGILLDCNRVCYLPMPSPFICDGTSFSLEQEECMEIKFSHPSDEQMLNLDEASSQEEPIDPCEQLKDNILYELHDQSRDQFQYKCSECHIDTESGYHCRECNDFSLCPTCYQSVDHEHPMDKLGLGLDTEGSFQEGPKDPREQRKASIEKCIRFLVHATTCQDLHCEQVSCIKMKRVLTHVRKCTLMLTNKWNKCKICKQFVQLCTSHAKTCNEDNCPVPLCARIKKNLHDQRNQRAVQRQRFMQMRMAHMSASVTNEVATVQNTNSSVASPATNSSPSNPNFSKVSPTNPATMMSMNNDSPIQSITNTSPSAMMMDITTDTSTTNLLENSDDDTQTKAAPGPSSTSDSEKRKQLQLQVVLLLHAHKCQRREREQQASGDYRQCTLPHCKTMKNVLNHMTQCQAGRSCTYPHCASSRQIIAHWKNCQRTDCPFCLPLKHASLAHGKKRPDTGGQTPSGTNIASTSGISSMSDSTSPGGPMGNPMAGPPGMQRKTSYPLPVPPIVSQPTQPWHDKVNPDLRQHLVKKLVEAIYPVHDPLALQDSRVHGLVQYAMRVEKVMFEAATNRTEYYKLLAQKIYHIRKELEDRKNQKKPQANEGVKPTGATGGGTTVSSAAQLSPKGDTPTGATGGGATVSSAAQLSSEGDTPTGATGGGATVSSAAQLSSEGDTPTEETGGGATVSSAAQLSSEGDTPTEASGGGMTVSSTAQLSSKGDTPIATEGFNPTTIN